MMLRWALTLTYIGVLVLAFVVQIFDPRISAYLFWGVLGWFVISLFLYRLPAMNRPISLGRKPATSGSGPPTAATAPLPSAPVDVGFCIHCGTPAAPGASVCPTCGRTILPV
ncbi:MAG TPA: zinc ribbon domain-containing protein [Thermoplasmata archaeon]|nr:zinc ribbon domain-containing protein [Thermoplasmata archaeon]